VSLPSTSIAGSVTVAGEAKALALLGFVGLALRAAARFAASLVTMESPRNRHIIAQPLDRVQIPTYCS
jgi:hypothetical protein